MAVTKDVVEKIGKIDDIALAAYEKAVMKNPKKAVIIALIVGIILGIILCNLGS